MKKTSLIRLFTCVWLALLAPMMGIGQDYTSELSGIWVGKLELGGGANLRLALTLSVSEGKLTGTMASPDQELFGVPISETILEGAHLRVMVGKINGEWEGDYIAKDDQLQGNWKQGGQSIACNLGRVDSIAKLRRPQTPIPPFPYKSEEVVVKNPAGGNQLAGTLTLPENNPKAPAVILITGSGAQDRDETIMGHKPFAVIADYLTRNGIAVLRMDDRGVGKSTGNPMIATSADFATDISAGVDYLKTRADIDPTQIGLIGHSEGGVIGPMVCVQRDDIAFLVMLAGLGMKGDELLIEQGRLISLQAGVSAEGIAKTAEYQRAIFDIIKKYDDVSDIKKRGRKFHTKFLKSCPEAIQQETGLTEAGLETTLKTMIQPWYRYFVNYDPATVLPKVKCPVLAVNGDKDLQVPAKLNLEGIEKLVKSGGNDQVLTRTFPGLNHLFQNCETGAISEYGAIEETFAPVVLKLVSDWISEQTH